MTTLPATKRWWRTSLGKGSLIAAAALVAVVGSVFLLRWIFGADDAHKIAETLGGVGALVATAFVALTLFLQSRELQLQREELKLQRDEMKQTRGELAEQSAALRRQAELMERGLAKELPRLRIEIEKVQLGIGRAPFHVVVRNIGEAAITGLILRTRKGEASEHERKEESLAPRSRLPWFPLPGEARAEAVKTLRQWADEILVKFRDVAGNARRWTVSTSQFASAEAAEFPEAAPGEQSHDEVSGGAA